MATPPTSPGPIPPPRPPRTPGARRGMTVHAACVAGACFVTPILMGSNLWPIAGVLWCVLTIPFALATGALTGWAVRRSGITNPMTALVVTGVAAAVVAGIIISRNR